MQSKKCSQNVLVFITASGLAEGPSADFSSFMWWQAALTLHREKSGSSYIQTSGEESWQLFKRSHSSL